MLVDFNVVANLNFKMATTVNYFLPIFCPQYPVGLDPSVYIHFSILIVRFPGTGNVGFDTYIKSLWVSEAKIWAKVVSACSHCKIQDGRHIQINQHTCSIYTYHYLNCYFQFPWCGKHGYRHQNQVSMGFRGRNMSKSSY